MKIVPTIETNDGDFPAFVVQLVGNHYDTL